MLAKGAAAVVAERDLGLGERQILVENSREFYGQLCAAWFGHPERKMRFIGVTGTNGKTTITTVIKNKDSLCINKVYYGSFKKTSLNSVLSHDQ